MSNTATVTKGKNSNILDVYIRDVIDYDRTLYNGRLFEMIEAYNDACPTTVVHDSLGRTRTLKSGQFTGPNKDLAQHLVWLCTHQMEKLRKSDNTSDQMLYQAYMESDRLPVTTNRGELCRIMKGKNMIKVSKSSLSTYIRKLQDAGIIIKKRNTTLRKVFLDDGTVIKEVADNGRGDFQLFLSKEIFHFQAAFDHLSAEGSHQSDMDVEKPENGVGKAENDHPGQGNPASEAKKSAIENQGVAQSKEQNLEQCISNKSNTENSINNNSGEAHCDESGVPSELKDDERLRLETYKLGRDSMAPVSAAARREISAADRPAAALDARETIQRKKEAMERKRELRDMVDRLTPSKERPFFVHVLFMEFVSMLYPDINREYLREIKPGLIMMLGTYLDLVPKESNKEGFRKLSRAIEMVWRYRQKHPGYQLYDPLHFLRMDYEGGFYKVVTAWLLKEELRLKIKAEKRSTLLKWQKGQAFADDLFDIVIEGLRTGIANSTALFADAENELSMYLGRIKAPQKTKDRIKASFKGRFQHLYRELKKQAREEKNDLAFDKTWNTFERYRNMLEKD